MSASLTCPACNKASQDGPACQRCGCDLSALHRIRRAAEARLVEARIAMRAGDWPGALAEAEASWDLRHSPEAAGCAFLASAALGDTAAACSWRRSAAVAKGS